MFKITGGTRIYGVFLINPDSSLSRIQDGHCQRRCNLQRIRIKTDARVSPASIKHIFLQTFEAGLRWGVRGTLSVFDQAAFAGSHFLISILFARWLSAEDYGAYALVYSFFFLAANFHNALILEPMSVVCSEEVSPYNTPLSAHHDNYSLRY